MWPWWLLTRINPLRKAGSNMFQYWSVRLRKLVRHRNAGGMRLSGNDFGSNGMPR
jgi:hypothetical protein